MMSSMSLQMLSTGGATGAGAGGSVASSYPGIGQPHSAKYGACIALEKPWSFWHFLHRALSSLHT